MQESFEREQVKVAKLETVEEIEAMLRAELQDSWSRFLESQIFQKYSELAKMLTSFYESGLREHIPHPAYQLAAQYIGRSFVEKAAQVGIAFDQIFPGNIEQSVESNMAEHEVRRFSFNAYRDGKLFAAVIISFPHVHGKFEFPKAPQIEMRRA